MIQPITMYEAICDSCGSEWNDDSVCAYPEPSTIRDRIINDGWLGGKMVKEHTDKVFCPNCYRMNDDDEYELIPKP